MSIDSRSSNLLLNEEQIENGALYVVAWRGWHPDTLEAVKNEIRSALANSELVRGVAAGGLMRKPGKVTKRPPMHYTDD